MPGLIKELHPTARKEHKCMFCGCKIEAGEQYRKAKKNGAQSRAKCILLSN